MKKQLMDLDKVRDILDDNEIEYIEQNDGGIRTDTDNEYLMGIIQEQENEGKDFSNIKFENYSECRETYISEIKKNK